MSKNNILFLTLVHPDFLPPVYAHAQVLRDKGYKIHILTFDSYVPSAFDLGANIELETVGKHFGISMSQRMALRKKFTERAKQLANKETLSIMAFCSFSFLCALKIKNKIPLLYNAIEIGDVDLSKLLKSPLSNYRNLLALKNIHKADLVATPSVQRSAWLAGRCRLGFMPYTIMNTVYLPGKEEAHNTLPAFKEVAPEGFLNKKIIIYTGAVNADQCIYELVQAFELVNDGLSALIITGFKDNEYCNGIRKYVGQCAAASRILLLPYVTRNQMLALQANAHIGVCFSKIIKNNIESYMIAPNKVGEYTAKKLYILGLEQEYLKPLEIQNMASLAKNPTPKDISIAMIKSLQAVSEQGFTARMDKFLKDFFCMQKQLDPVVKFLSTIPQ